MSGIEAVFCRSAPWRLFARRVVLPWALDGTRIGSEVLELGGGSGAMAAQLLEVNGDLRVTVGDVDPAMVKAAFRRLAPFGGRARAVVADATKLDYDDGSFDTVCLWLMLHHTIEWEQAIDEASRVLRPGGSLIGYDLTDRMIARLIHRLDRSPHRLVTPAQLSRQVATAGFTDVSVRTGLVGHVMRFAATRAT